MSPAPSYSWHRPPHPSSPVTPFSSMEVGPRDKFRAANGRAMPHNAENVASFLRFPSEVGAWRTTAEARKKAVRLFRNLYNYGVEFLLSAFGSAGRFRGLP